MGSGKNKKHPTKEFLQCENGLLAIRAVGIQCSHGYANKSIILIIKKKPFQSVRAYLGSHRERGECTLDRALVHHTLIPKGNLESLMDLMYMFGYGHPHSLGESQIQTRDLLVE